MNTKRNNLGELWLIDNSKGKPNHDDIQRL